MADVQHSNLKEGSIHPIANWKVNNASIRNDLDVTSEDIGKIAHQTNNDTFWALISTAPSWKKLLTTGDKALPEGPAGGHLQGNYPNPIVRPDSHTHTQATLPPYPTTLPPNGLAGGDLTGNYPNPTFKLTGVTPGEYPRATVTVNDKGLVTNIEAGVDNSDQLPAVQTPDYDDDTETIATTKYVTRGGIRSNELSSGETLIISTNYSKEVHKVYSIKGTLVVAGSLYITDDVQTDQRPNFVRMDETIVEDHFKLVVSGYSIKEDTKILIKGILKVI